jgi:hypothetical protein
MKRYPCHACLSLSAFVRLDKKGRPMIQCELCSHVSFARSSLQLFHQVATARLLENPETLQWVREKAIEMASQPGALESLLRTAARTAEDVPQRAAEREAASG